MVPFQWIFLLTTIPWVYCDNGSSVDNNLTTRNAESDQQPVKQNYQPIVNSESLRPLIVQRYPYLVPDERVYQPYVYKAPTGIKYPSWPAPVPWPPKYPPAKPEEDKEQLEKSFLKVMYPAIIIFALGSFFIPLLIIYNYKGIYGFGAGGGPIGGCGCVKKEGKHERSRLGRSHFIVNLINLMVTIEKALSEVEQKFMTGKNEQSQS
uniref:Resistance to inhibitors of cholinesterase protein 3 N-terminal domain-containing protein n=1 Tax=Tetranychus urticae TaxID=32264 RepID=T1KMU7_TETUR